MLLVRTTKGGHIKLIIKMTDNTTMATFSIIMHQPQEEEKGEGHLSPAVVAHSSSTVNQGEGKRLVLAPVVATYDPLKPIKK